MEAHHVLARQYIASLHDATAFSALPGAPVLAERPPRFARLAAAARRVGRAAPRRTPRARPVPAFASDGASDSCSSSRMSACA